MNRAFSATMSRLDRRPRLSLGFALFMAALAWRLFLILRLSGSPFLLPHQGDMQFYNDWARRILAGQWTDHHAFYGLPLYPYLLAGLYKLFGYNVIIPAFLQAAADAGTSWLLYRIALLAFPANQQQPLRGAIIGAIAALGWVFFVPSQAYGLVLMPTAPFVFAFWFVVWQIVQRRERPRPLWFFFIGGLIGFVAMGIASILFLLPLILLAAWRRWPSSLSSQSRACGLLVAGLFLGMAPCWIHNYVVARDPVLLSAHSGVNFWIGNNPQANGYPNFPPGLHADQKAMLQDSITAAEKAAGHPLPRSQVSAFWSGQAGRWIASHPLTWLKLLAVKMKNFWSAFQYDDISVITPLREGSVIFPGLAFGIVAALAIPGLILACREAFAARWVAAAILLHMFSILTVFVTERYRLAAVPGLLLFCAYGLWAFWRGVIAAHYRTVFTYSGFLIASFILVSWPQRDSSLWALDSYNTGLRALDAGELSTARKKLDLAYAYSPYNAEVNFAEGNLHLALGHPQQAKAYYLSTLRLDPAHGGSANNLGVLALEEGHGETAIKFFRLALTSSPTDAKLHYLLARAAFESGHRLAAKRAIAEALKLLPAQPEFVPLRNQIEQTSPSARP